MGCCYQRIDSTCHNKQPSEYSHQSQAKYYNMLMHKENKTTPDDSTDSADFGYRKVARGDKRKLVDGVFSSVAARYDIMNDMMSAGIHRLWKRHYIATCGLRPGDRLLDLAGGTGDIARLAWQRLQGDVSIVLADINMDMIRVGRQRLDDQGLVSGIDYLQANAEQLPFADATFNVITMAFGLRNVTDKPAALREMRRVLKPGGRAVVLEFSQVTQPAAARAYDWYSFNVLPRLGQMIAGDRDSYQYLAESIRKHPDQETLKQMFLHAGFAAADYRNLSAGMVAIHRGVSA